MFPFEQLYLPHDGNHWLLPQIPEMDKRKESQNCTVYKTIRERLKQKLAS